MTLTEQLTDYVHAAFTGLYLETNEPDEAEREITAMPRQQDWKLACWDIARGLRLPSHPGTSCDAAPGDQLAVCESYPLSLTPTAPLCFFSHNYQQFLNQPRTDADGLRSTRRRQAAADLSRRPAPLVQLPIELEELFSSWIISCPIALSWSRSPAV